MTDKPKSKIIPNSFQTPNAHVDQAMRFLSGDEYKVLNFAVRHIYGWQDRPRKYQGRISLSVFVDGFTTEDGNRYYGCGLQRNSVSKILQRLVSFGLLVEDDEITQAGKAWSIGSDPNWGLLEEALGRREQANNQRGAKMITARLVKQGVMSDVTSNVAHAEGVMSDIDGGVMSDSTHTNTSLSHVENHDFLPATQRKSATPPKEKKPATENPTTDTLTGDEWQALIAAIGDVFKAYGVQAINYANMLTGKARKGEWGKCNLDPIMRAAELRSWWKWYQMTNPGLSIKKPELVYSSIVEYRKQQQAKPANGHSGDYKPIIPDLTSGMIGTRTGGVFHE